MNILTSSPSSPRRSRNRLRTTTAPRPASTTHPAATANTATLANAITTTTATATLANTTTTATDRLLRRTSIEHKELGQLLELMGWQTVPTELLSEILDDLAAFADELSGAYSTVCPHVLRRRRSIDFWVRSAMDGTCSIGTAREALRVTSLGSPA